jgi:hypothetical protein
MPLTLGTIEEARALGIPDVVTVIGSVPVRKSKASPEPATANTQAGAPNGKPGSTEPEDAKA